MELYKRNRIYISTEDQDALSHYKIFLAGCGIGSVIAECAIRLGFENITIVDSDIVELTNINRQNYTSGDIGRKKVDALKDRLLAINPHANILTYDKYLTPETNISEIVDGCNVAINALDFQSNAPFIFDGCCKAQNIPILHPYNIGWATLIYVIIPGGPDLSLVSSEYYRFDLKIMRYFLKNLKDRSKIWVERLLNEYEAENGKQSPPQLSIGSWLGAGACVNLI